MKLAIASDLHLEHDINIKLTNDQQADVLILAGDIVPISLLQHGKHRNKYIQFFKDAAAQFKIVLYVVGNHEYYGGDVSTDVNSAREILGSINNLTILDDEDFSMAGVTFIGSTLWTDFDDRDPIKMMVAKRTMNDYKAVEYSGNPVSFRRQDGTFTSRPAKLTPEDTAEFYQISYDFIDNVAQICQEKVVVIAHHAPSYLSSHARYAGDPLSSAFCSDSTDLMERNPNIKLFIHGHTHDSFDYLVYDTRVICNPRGYPHEQSFLNFSLKYLEV